MMERRRRRLLLSGFKPTQLSSLFAWYEASDLQYITKDGSNLVSTWADRSGNGYDVTASGAARPTWTANQLNGLPVLDFDGVGNYFISPSGVYTLANGDNTVFAVAKTDDDTSLQVIFGLAEAGVTRLDLRYTAVAGSIYYQSRTSGSGGVTQTSVTDTTYGILMGRREGTTQAIAYDNGTEVTNASGASEAAVDTASIGSFNATTSFLLNGQIAEIIVCNDALSSSDINIVNNYLSNKYGIAV